MKVQFSLNFPNLQTFNHNPKQLRSLFHFSGTNCKVQTNWMTSKTYFMFSGYFCLINMTHSEIRRGMFTCLSLRNLLKASCKLSPPFALSPSLPPLPFFRLLSAILFTHSSLQGDRVMVKRRS